MSKPTSVEELFEKNKRRPLTPLEILSLVEKSKAGTYNEIKSLIKHEYLERIEIDISDSRMKLVLYRRRR